jgi:hypothetical protein
MSTQYRLVQSGKTASGGCSAGPRFVRAVPPRIIIIIIINLCICINYGGVLKCGGEWLCI